MELQQPTTLHQPMIDWFGANARDLPWRHTRDPWAILLCEVMSQQTPVARVEPTWRAWLERWPSPADLAVASPAEVLIAWDRMGYPRRALRLQECARHIVRDYDGAVPSNREDLLALPGIGPYTADAVLAFAFEQRSVVLDTNIRRVLARWHGEALPRPSQTRAEERRADAFVPVEPHMAAQWNAAIMEFGALVCTARKPDCAHCPFTGICEWYQQGRPADAWADKRKTQAWSGTNRQARGAIMAALRKQPQNRAALLSATGLEETRFDVAIASLVADSLVSLVADAYSLPGH